MGERPAGATRRYGSHWVVAGGLVATVVVGVLTDARVGSFALAAVLTVAAVVRGVWPDPGPEALVARRRWLDVTLLGLLAIAVAVLATIVPGAV